MAYFSQNLGYPPSGQPYGNNMMNWREHPSKWNSFNSQNIIDNFYQQTKIKHPNLITIDGDIIDYDTDLLVSGYIREAQKLLSTTKIINIIPLLVNIKCIKFYHCPEGMICWGPRLKVDLIKSIVSYNVNNYDQHYNTVYGKIQIDQDSLYIYEWTFKIIGSAWGITIGICTNPNPANVLNMGFNNLYKAISNGGYQYQSSNFGMGHHKIGAIYPESQGFKADDIITMRVDVPKRTITYYVGGDQDDDKNKQVHYSQDLQFYYYPNTPYQMAISLGYPNGNVQLVRFRKMLSKFSGSTLKWQ